MQPFYILSILLYIKCKFKLNNGKSLFSSAAIEISCPHFGSIFHGLFNWTFKHKFNEIKNQFKKILLFAAEMLNGLNVLFQPN